MTVPTRKTHGPGPAERAVLAAQDAHIHHSPPPDIVSIAGQVALAKQLDRLGRQLFGEKWDQDRDQEASE
jgi:hypothetical protein